MLGNSAALELFAIVRNQLIVAGMGGVVAVNQISIWKIIEMYDKYNKLPLGEDIITLFEKLVYLGQLHAEHLNSKST